MRFWDGTVSCTTTAPEPRVGEGECCQEHGHNEVNCPKPRSEACDSSDHHRNAGSFECVEHKYTKCKGAMGPKGHKRNNCPETFNTICTAKKLVAMKSDAQRSRVLHAVVGRTLS